MDKNAEIDNEKSGNKSAGIQDPSLLDGASLFAYWNRDPTATANAAVSNPLFTSQFGPGVAGLGLVSNTRQSNERYTLNSTSASGHHNSNTIAVAASQAASLAGLHPAASWWSMAQLAAAQDYFSRLQASSLSQFSQGDLSSNFPSGLTIPGISSGTTNNAQGNSSANSSPTCSNSKSNQKPNRKEKRLQNSVSNSCNTISLHNLGSNTTISSPESGSSDTYKLSSLNKSSSQINTQTSPVTKSAYNSAALHKELLAMQAAAVSVAQQRQQYQPIQNSSKKSHHSQHASLVTPGGNISSNSKCSIPVTSSIHNSSLTSNNHHNFIYSNSSSVAGNIDRISSSTSKDRNNERTNQAQTSLSALNSLSHLSALGLTSQQNVQAAMSVLVANSEKVKNYMPQGILSAALEGNDSSSFLGVRLPPDTEIIKYTSSIVGPKIPGTTNRGRKKTISLDPNPLLAFPGLSPAKRCRLEMEYAAVMGQVVAAQQAVAQAANNFGGSGPADSRSQFHPSNNSSSLAAASSTSALAASKMSPHSAGATTTALLSLKTKNNFSPKASLPSFQSLEQNMVKEKNNRNENRNDQYIEKEMKYENKNSDNVEVIKLRPTIVSNGAYNFSNKVESKSIFTKDLDSESNCINLSFKCGASSFFDDLDTPLNLSMKPCDKVLSNNEYSQNDENLGSANSLQSLSSITAALGMANTGEPSIPSVCGNNNQNSSSNLDRANLNIKEVRPRNLGRGVSKPKKNTVASLLAQSRAVGIKPMIATQQLLQQGVDLDKIRQVLEANNQLDVSTDSESFAAESGLSESESDDQNIFNLVELRVPLDRGWKRETIIRGLTKLGQIRGDVCYYAPGSVAKLQNVGEVLNYLDKNPSKLSRENFSFSSRAILGSFLQPAPPPFANDGEFIRMSDIDVAKRLEDLKVFTRQNLNVEQRIEIAKQQQVIRDAKKLAKEEIARSKEKARQEKSEKLEQQRKERELKTHQASEARKKRQEELDKVKQEDVLKKQQDKEKKKQEAIFAKEQEINKQKAALYQIELEKERQRQHLSWIRQFDIRKKFEEREKKKHQLVLDKLILREKRVATRKHDAEILFEIRKAVEDSEITNQIDLPDLTRFRGCRLPGQAIADLLMIFEFLHNFGETLGFDMESLPSFQNLHDALVADSNAEAEEELLSIMTHLLVCAIEDPGIPNPGRHTTLLGQSLRTADITNSNVSEILRIYLYAIATGEVRQMSGIALDREKEKRIADHHQFNSDLLISVSGKNQQYYDLLHENETWKLSTCLNDKPFVSLNPTKKTKILAHLVNDLLMNKAVLKQIEGSLEACAQTKREKYTNDMKIRKYKSLHIRKLRIEQYEKVQHERELAIQQQIELTRKEAAEVAAKKAQENNKQEKIIVSTENNLNEKLEVQDELLSQSNRETETRTNNKQKMENYRKIELVSTSTTSTIANENELTFLNEEIQSERTEEDSHIKLLDSTSHITADQIVANTSTETNQLVISSNKKVLSRIHDDASTDVGMEEDLSDVESVITNLEEDEDMKMTAEEVLKKLEKMIKLSEQMKISLEKSTSQLRAQYYGQDRYWRRYWKLPKAGGIFVEAIESGQNEILEYHNVLEKKYKEMKTPGNSERYQNLELKAEKKVKQESEIYNDVYDSEEDLKDLKNFNENEFIKNNQNKIFMEIDKNRTLNEISKIKSDDENNKGLKSNNQFHDDFSLRFEYRTEKSVINNLTTKKSEKYVDQPDTNLNSNDDNKSNCTNNNNNNNNKRSNDNNSNNNNSNNSSNYNNNFNNHNTYNTFQISSDESKKQINSSNNLCIKNLSNNSGNNFITTPFMIDKVKRNISLKNETVSAFKYEINKDKSDNIATSTEKNNHFTKLELSSTSTASDKWFSIINREMPLISNENQYIPEYQLAYSNITCDQNIQIQGHRWDIVNNAQYFCVPLENNKVDFKFDDESILTSSGLKDEVIESVIQAQKPEKRKSELEILYNGMRENINDIKLNVSKEEQTNSKTDKSEIKLDDVSSISLNNLANMTLSNISAYVACDNTFPLSMTPEEHSLLENIKNYGFPKRKKNNFVEAKLRHGWWTITDLEILKLLINCLNPKGIRECDLKQNLLKALNEPIELEIKYSVLNNFDFLHDFIEPDKPTNWNSKIAKRVELTLLDQLEALEDKIANASMQVKNWQMPQRIDNELPSIHDEFINNEDFVSIISMLRERIISLEAAIERRYLKPPLGLQVGDAQLAVIAQNQMNSNQNPNQQVFSQDSNFSQSNLTNCSQNSNDEVNNIQIVDNIVTANSSGDESPSSISSDEDQLENMPKGLVQWREAVSRSHTTSQLAMALYLLESCVAWDKSIMKANCQFCSSGENEDKLLLCDGCDKGYHTYCFKPKMENIPDGDWYCYECLNKATNERKCIVCGGHRPPPLGRMVYCELCPRAFHCDCYIPPLLKVPRGKWYCNSCAAKAPPPKKRSQKKNSTKEHKEKDKDKEKEENSKDKSFKQINEPSLLPHSSSFQQISQVSNEEMATSPNHSIISTSYDDLQNNSIDGIPGTSSNKYPSIVTLPPHALPSILSMTAAAPTTPIRSITPTQIQNINNNSNVLLESTISDDCQNSNFSQQQVQSQSPTASITSNTSQGSIALSTSLQINNQEQQIQSNQLMSQKTSEYDQDRTSVISTSILNSSLSHSVSLPLHNQQVQQQNFQFTEAKEKLKQEKKEKLVAKKLTKELSVCKTVLTDMEIHEDSWPFLLPVNTKQFPTYKKIIKNPMDLSTIKKRVQDLIYKTREEFINDVRQIFDNCEMFNEDDSPVGKAGHVMRKYFEMRWAELTDKYS